MEVLSQNLTHRIILCKLRLAYILLIKIIKNNCVILEFLADRSSKKPIESRLQYLKTVICEKNKETELKS